MNKTILLLNALILVVNFVLAMASTGLQGELLAAGVDSRASIRREQHVPTGRAFARVLSSLESVVPPDQLNKLTPDQMRAIERAVSRYLKMSEAAAEDALTASEAGSVRARLAELSKQNRLEIERMLSPELGQHGLTQQVTTAIIRVA